MGGSLSGACRASPDTTMSKRLLAVLMLASLSTHAARAAGPSLCSRLAGEVRKAPAATWAQPDPLAAWVKPARQSRPSPIVTALASDARWREQVVASENRPLAVQQLDGTPIYMVDDVAGTGRCQSLVLVEALPGRPSRQLKPPFEWQRMNLCTTQSAFFATVLGQPAFVVGGAPSMTSPDIHYRIASWNGRGWAPHCSVKLRRTTAMTLAQRFCPPGGEVCDAGQPVAQRLAQAYEVARHTGKPLDAQAFNGGARPDAALAAVKPALNPQFPLFGADEKPLDPMRTVFSNADPRALPVLVKGRWWLAIVGRSGVGWREGDAVLVALFTPPAGEVDGVASYQFRIAPAGLRDVTATAVRR